MSFTTDKNIDGFRLFHSIAKKTKVRQQTNGWADEDVDGFKGKEFDFQANLDMFDKKKVFAEIQASL